MFPPSHFPPAFLPSPPLSIPPPLCSLLFPTILSFFLFAFFNPSRFLLLFAASFQEILPIAIPPSSLSPSTPMPPPLSSVPRPPFISLPERLVVLLSSLSLSSLSPPPFSSLHEYTHLYSSPRTHLPPRENKGRKNSPPLFSSHTHTHTHTLDTQLCLLLHTRTTFCPPSPHPLILSSSSHSSSFFVSNGIGVVWGGGVGKGN